MAVDPTAAMNRIVTVIGGLSGVQSVVKGVPGSLDAQVGAYVTLDRWTVPDHATQLLRHAVDVAVTFAYRTVANDGGVSASAAETALAAVVGAYVTAMVAERKTALAATCDAVSLPDFSRATEPRYAAIAGQEFRLLPSVVHLTFQETFSLS